MAALRRTPAVIGQLFWHPFDVRFKNIEERFEFHRQNLRDKIGVLSLNQAVGHSQLLTNERGGVANLGTDLKEHVRLLAEMKVSINSRDHSGCPYDFS